jgi:hypothetical protein
LIGKKREVSDEDIQIALKGFTHDVKVDPETGKPLCHVKYAETSTKLGTGCDQVNLNWDNLAAKAYLTKYCWLCQCQLLLELNGQLISTVIDVVMKRPSKAEVNTPDSVDGMWGSLLRKYEWARVVNQGMEDTSKVTNKLNKRTGKIFRPIFRLNWLPKMPTLPAIPVPERMKVFPHRMWFCFCLRQPPSAESDDEEEHLVTEKDNEVEEESEDSDASE